MQYVIQSRFIYHVIWAFISRNTEPDVCIGGFNFIFEMDTEDMAASHWGNRAMVVAATIVSMAAADGEHTSIFPLVCPNKARCVLFSALDI